MQNESIKPDAVLDKETESKMDKEFNEAMNEDQNEGMDTGPKVAPKRVKLSLKAGKSLLDIENRLVLLPLKDPCPAHVKEAALGAIAPTKEEIESTTEMMELFVERFMPQLKVDPLYVAMGIHAAGLSMRLITVLEFAAAYKAKEGK